MKLIVKPLDRKSAGKGIAAIDREAMEKLGVTNGDFVTIRGEEGTAVARVRPDGQASDNVVSSASTARRARPLVHESISLFGSNRPT